MSDESDAYGEAAMEMANMLYADSHIPVAVSFTMIYGTLRRDGRIPDLYEMECLTMGGPLSASVDDGHPDTGGEGNPDVDARFPHTNKAIGEMF